MDETILFPSPNWFQPSGLAVSSDEWLVYGGPSKSLCVLEPLPADYEPIVQGQQGYTAHVVNRAHPEKIVCVDICPEWPEKRAVLTGSADGAVKQWSLERANNTLKIKSTHSHEIHSHDKEEVAGVGYCKDGYAVTVGSFGNIVKWDLNSNVAKSFNHVLKSFKPVCMACSPHIHMNIAIGTKQGVVFVLDLNGSPRILYKVRGQDDEIIKVSWCPQYEVAVRKSLKESDKRSAATERMAKIRQEPETPEVMQALDERVKNSQTTEQPTLINEKSEPVVTGSQAEVLDESGIGKTLPEDSFDDSIVVPEDDMFDIYKDHEADEFGHKKFEPTDIIVKVTEEAPKEDYLTECQRLKEEILKRKEASTIEALVDAMDKTAVEEKAPKPATTSKPESPMEGKIIKGEVESSVHIHKHLLATIGKHGSIRVWSKSGKLVGSCSCGGGGGGGGRGAARGGASTLLWARPDMLLIADGKSQLLDCNPLKIDCKNKLSWRVLHSSHKRGLFALACTSPRVQSPGTRAPAAVWSAGQDRALLRYNLDDGELKAYATCGGFLYTVQVCPYDARKVAVSVGDGAVRVWESDASDEVPRLSHVAVHSHWQHVQGKVLATAWHPTREGLLAFATAEARVGIISTGGKTERAARVLPPALSGGVYSLSWGEGGRLYACAAGELVCYDVDNIEAAPVPVAVSFEAAAWEISCVVASPRSLLVGSCAGAVAALTTHHPHDVRAAVYVYSKMIHTMDWHPEQTSSASEPSAYKDHIAVCSLDKANTIAILHYTENEDSTAQLVVWKTLSGHKGSVLQVSWSPHRDEELLSTSQDGTVRIWDITSGHCTSIFGSHSQAALGAAWSPRPQLPRVVMSGGGDCCLRLWDADTHPASLYQETKHETAVEKKKKKKDKREKKAGDESSVDADDQAAAVCDTKVKSSKKFLLPMIYRQMNPCGIQGPRKMLQMYLEKAGDVVRTENVNGEEFGLDYIKMFGNINEVNEVLDVEMERHQDTGGWEAWALVCIVRGYVDAALQLAAARDLLDPLLLSLAPSVSFKYWKDATQLYLQQIDRLVAKGEEAKIAENKWYGGPVLRKMAVQLSMHDVKAAVATLVDARLFPEAYVLSRTRYMDSLAEQTLRLWAHDTCVNGHYNTAAVCYIALGDLAQAAAVLGKSSDEESLSLAADIAKVLGQTTFAGHIEEKRELIKSKKELLEKLDKQGEEKQELTELLSRAELVIKENDGEKEQLVEPDNDTVKDNDAEKLELTQLDEATGAEPVKESNVETQDLTEQGKDTIKDELAVKEDIEEQQSTKTDKDTKTENTNEAANTDEKESIATETENGGEGKTIEKILDVPKREENEVDKLLEDLPEKMEGLLKDAVQNGTHKGDGDTIQNGEAADQQNNNDASAKPLENCPETVQGKSATE